MSDESYVLRTMLELIRIDSESLNEREAADYVASRLREMGVETAEDGAGAALGGNAGNLTALLKGSVPGAPTIMLNAHLDTV
ncbi:MAG TPA: peptidase M20, partial [bacterium]|nr:peptidase M20 [bacterium]